MQPQKRSTKPTLINSTYTTPQIQKFEGTLTRRTTSKIPYSFSQLSELVTKPLGIVFQRKSPTKSLRRGRSKQKQNVKSRGKILVQFLYENYIKCTRICFEKSI
ncbi:hypothetical protein CEXT_233381 [Caerostris extrusa]|uniref:Ribosomal protein S18 n=1 Tax=Caerostris extrusa TaxID=172846 RepID=A0AAV4X0F0_CAEEX|nr:hypothetical protein CEXT_233381 [Caerostris extrusa]